MVPKSPPSSATSETLTPQTFVPGTLGRCSRQFLARPCSTTIPSESELRSHTDPNGADSSITLCVDPQHAAPELPGGLPPPSGHSASSSRPAATKTRRRGTCALGTGATLAAKLGMLSRLSRSGWPGGKSEPGRSCSVGIGVGMPRLLMGRSSCRYQSLVPLARPGLFQAGLKGGGERGVIKSLPPGHP